jgi:hypothetical protein
MVLQVTIFAGHNICWSQYLPVTIFAGHNICHVALQHQTASTTRHCNTTYTYTTYTVVLTYIHILHILLYSHRPYIE